MSGRCEFTDLPADACAHCLGHADPQQQARQDRARLIASGRGWFAALYRGACEHCGERIEPGMAIRMEVPSGWRGECCAEATR